MRIALALVCFVGLMGADCSGGGRANAPAASRVSTYTTIKGPNIDFSTARVATIGATIHLEGTVGESSVNGTPETFTRIAISAYRDGPDQSVPQRFSNRAIAQLGQVDVVNGRFGLDWTLEAELKLINGTTESLRPGDSINILGTVSHGEGSSSSGATTIRIVDATQSPQAGTPP